MEAQSPPYIFGENSFASCKFACRTLTNEFRVETNPSTGLHVHVAEGADGYALQKVKKLIVFLWTFKSQIDQLHPNRRAELCEDEGNMWHESLRPDSEVTGGKYTDRWVQLTVFQGLKYIYRANSLSALDNMMRADSYKAVFYIEHIGTG